MLRRWLAVLLVTVALGCVGEEPNAPTAPTAPAQEVCDGVDDDEDGLVDDVTCPSRYDCARPASCQCARGYTRCGDVCSRTDDDPTNCGACRQRCALGDVCVRGGCRHPGALRRCSDVEVDVYSDSANCGRCGYVCGEGSACVEGACTCLGATRRCGDVCVDVSSDRSHCGGCGLWCPLGAFCVFGRCVCPSGQSVCNGVCVSLRSDGTNCGSCGRRCPAASVCAGGRCGCSTGQSLCDSGCVDTMRDESNCGGCYRACAANAVCVDGACECPAGQTHCGGRCVDVGSDPANCGECGAQCAGSGQRCTSGVCQCEGGGTVCGASCVDLRTDPRNCGACGVACGSGGGCVSGACTPLPRTPLAGARIGTPRPTFRWDSGDAVVEVCADRACATVVAGAAGTARSGATLTADLAPGSYFWRVVRDGQTRATTRALVVDARRTRTMGLLPPSPDLDGDGRADVVALSNVDARAYALRPGSDLPVVASTFDFLRTLPQRATLRASGDLDGDGRVDAAFNLDTRMYRSRCSGAEAMQFAGWPTLGDLLPLADLDRDGQVDMAEVVDGAVGVSYGFPHGMDFGLVGLSPSLDTLAPVGDVDGDGTDDVVLSTPASSSPRAFVFFGSSAGLDRSLLLPFPPRSVGFGAWVSAAGDVNGDGYADALVAMGTSGAAVYLGGPDAITFHRAITSTTGDDLRVFAAGDLDGDGFYDLLALPAAQGEAHLYRGGASGLAAAPVVIRDDRLATVETAGAMGDRDGDGLDDVVLGAPSSDLVLILHGVRGAAPSRVTEIRGDRATEFGRAVL